MGGERDASADECADEIIDEFEEVLGSAPLRQGDIFEWISPFSERPWRQLAVIVTADCDMARNKMDNVVSFVPLLSFEDYVWNFWRQKRFAQPCALSLQELHKFINKQLGKQSKAEISIDAAQDWAIRANAEEIATGLTIKDANSFSKLKAVWAKFSEINALIQADSPSHGMLLKASEHLKKPGQTASEFLAAEFQSSLAKLPGDVFFLSQIGDLGHGSFGMLRYIRQCHLEDIAVEPDQVRFGNAKARRLARLRPTFKYALTQQLARVFSDIGLPPAYDERVKARSAEYFGRASQ